MLKFLRRDGKAAGAAIARTDRGYEFGADTASDIVRAARQDRWEGWLTISFVSVGLVFATLAWAGLLQH
ncbi:hypothetical protein [Dryocola sp. BD586]|uniref:hypothetical protein n=1 Tax=Dryocola sp. BD586 TaxID=3133271 RepID=UPI003F4F4E85